ncbi:hypothetical protein [Bradyrhizobium sp. CB2312]|uniref:hypothetical protein n=1 Tax=Bradyrhizobium sp. CB2312 TaxID=3039155 RepID=UPI0024B158D0|nr:hypothetical protein [Bradyrhizobium sp. CB2312]WFU69790.1 hypothetical protein QA642_31525 [Bradyrhizobium sp. CB2312]
MFTFEAGIPVPLGVTKGLLCLKFAQQHDSNRPPNSDSNCFKRGFKYLRTIAAKKSTEDLAQRRHNCFPAKDGRQATGRIFCRGITPDDGGSHQRLSVVQYQMVPFSD